MKIVDLFCSFLDQHGYAAVVTDNKDDHILLSLKKHDDMIAIYPNLDVFVYCDIITWVKDEPQLAVNLYNPYSLKLITKYLRCIPKRKKRNGLL